MKSKNIFLILGLLLFCLNICSCDKNSRIPNGNIGIVQSTNIQAGWHCATTIKTNIVTINVNGYITEPIYFGDTVFIFKGYLNGNKCNWFHLQHSDSDSYYIYY